VSPSSSDGLQTAPSDLLYNFSRKRLRKGTLKLKLLVVSTESADLRQKGKKRDPACRAVVDPIACSTLARTPGTGMTLSFQEC
jgi:hypothetical protein